MKKNRVPEAAGAMLVLLLPYFWVLLIPGSLFLLHHQLPMTGLVCGILLDMLGFLVLGLVTLALLARLPPVPRRIVAAALAGFFLWRAWSIGVSSVEVWIENQSDIHQQMQRASLLSWLATQTAHYSRYCAVGIPLLLALIAATRPAIINPLVKAVRLSLAALSFSCLWIVPLLLYYGFALRDSPRPIAQASTASSHPDARIIWILFDELSENLVFDHRPAGQQFPNFDALRAQSTLLGNVQGFGSYTDRIIPSLLAGHEIRKIRASSNGNYLYFDQQQNKWEAYDPKASLLYLAQQQGWNPAVAGSEIPYCRIFKDELNACSWLSATLPVEAWIPPGDPSILSAALAIPRTFLASLTPGAKGGNARVLDQAIFGYRFMLDRATALIREGGNQDGDYRFLFLHLPVPHPPGIYNRRTHQLVEGGNYLDNLTLADDTMGVLWDEIAKTPWAAQTTVIVSSDHSWRVPIWRPNEDWTPEEESNSQGRFDRRPVFLVHFPGQTTGHDIFAPIPELAEHDVIASILEGKLKNAGDLQTALAAEPETSPAPPAPRAH
jgi:hypothetical protein